MRISGPTARWLAALAPHRSSDLALRLAADASGVWDGRHALSGLLSLAISEQMGDSEKQKVDRLAAAMAIYAALREIMEKARQNFSATGNPSYSETFTFYSDAARAFREEGRKVLESEDPARRRALLDAAKRTLSESDQAWIFDDAFLPPMVVVTSPPQPVPPAPPPAPKPTPTPTPAPTPPPSRT